MRAETNLAAPVARETQPHARKLSNCDASNLDTGYASSRCVDVY